MTTYVRATEAARRLGVTTPTLYSYVSRGRVTRTLGKDGRSSLFDVVELDALRERNRRPPPRPATIDVRIATSITQLNEDGLRYRDVPVAELVDTDFERVAELLWSGTLPTTAPCWPDPPPSTRRAVPASSPAMALIQLATQFDPAADAISTGRNLLMASPGAWASDGRPPPSVGRLADRLAQVWAPGSPDATADVINAALVLLADHELATSTLAVRVAASVRSSPAGALIAGLGTVDGELHGSASHHAQRMLELVAADGAESVLTQFRAAHRRVPGFGHAVYRQRDPRFELLLERVSRLDDPAGRFDTVTELLGVSGRYIAQPPNVDLALGALTYVADLPIDCSIFAIARISGWIAHYLEEIDERPVRYRGLAQHR